MDAAGAPPNSQLSNLAMLTGRVLLVLALLPNGLRKVADFHVIAAGIGGVVQTIHGHQFPATPPLFVFPLPQTMLGISVLFDIGGTLLLMLGLYTRTIAVAMTIYCSLATIIFHYNVGIPENAMAVLRNLSLIGGLIVVSGVGGGDWSLSGWLRRRGQ